MTTGELDIEQLKHMDKDTAMPVILHCLNAARQLVKYEPTLARTLTNIARTVQIFSKVDDQYLAKNEDIAAAIRKIAQQECKVVTTEDL